MDLQQVLQQPIEYLLLGLSVLLLLSVFASKASGKMGIPALLLFIAIGMLAGSEGPGGIQFDYPRLAQSLGVAALALILFSGGLETRWGDIRPVFWHGLLLATVGVFITAGLVAWFATTFLEFSRLEGFLLGAIVSATDAAAVFTVLRAGQARLPGRLTALLEFESGSNDPMAVFLTVGVISLLSRPDPSVVMLFPQFLLQMGLGALLGYSMGMAIVFVINHVRLEQEALYAVLSLAGSLFIYGFTASVGGNGFLAVYLAGMVVANSEVGHREYLARFHDSQAWLMQILMFLTLGLQVFPSQVIPVIGIGLILSLFLIFVARPVSVFLTLIGSRFSTNEKFLISWAGLRGAVPIVLATFPLIAGLPKAEMIFNLVFFIVLTSVLLQGSTLSLVVSWLRLTASDARPIAARGKFEVS
jgi:cell volume regulation protein A